jgi:hypothetical protein
LKIEKQNDKLHVVDVELGIDVIISNDGYKGKGVRKHREVIEASVNQYLLNEVTKDMEIVSNFKDGVGFQSFFAIVSITQTGRHISYLWCCQFSK